jgi:hypothetical protein
MGKDWTDAVDAAWAEFPDVLDAEGNIVLARNHQRYGFLRGVTWADDNPQKEDE